MKGLRKMVARLDGEGTEGQTEHPCALCLNREVSRRVALRHGAGIGLEARDRDANHQFRGALVRGSVGGVLRSGGRPLIEKWVG